MFVQSSLFPHYNGAGKQSSDEYLRRAGNVKGVFNESLVGRRDRSESFSFLVGSFCVCEIDVVKRAKQSLPSY